MTYELLGFLVLAVLVLGIGWTFSARGRSPFPQRLVVAAICLRIVGSIARYEILMRYYDGVGDAGGYYGSGVRFADRLWSFDLSVLGWSQWFGGPNWWGTEFIRNLSGLVISVIGPTMRGEFLVFSMISFVGLYWIAVAFLRRTDETRGTWFAILIWLWPSLWFWPSSIGKEAVIVFAIGLAFLGYVGDGQKINLVKLLAGLALAFAVRPHVAFLVAMAIGVAYWLISVRRFSARRVVQGMVIGGIILATFYGMRQQFGLLEADLEGIREYISFRAFQTQTGGSELGAVPSGLVAIPMAFVNVWMRPFVWEAHNVTSLASGIEMLVLLLMLVLCRRGLGAAIRNWRRDRVVAFALAFVVGYTLMIGLTFANLGLIARQRTPAFIFLFMLPVAFSAAVPSWVGRRRRARVGLAVPERA